GGNQPAEPLRPPQHRCADAHHQEESRVARIAERLRAELDAVHFDHALGHVASYSASSPGEGRISTYPAVPCTRIRCPSRISRVAFSTPTTAGKPYSRAITAPWVIRPPTSVTRPAIATNRGVQLGSV